MDLPKMINKSEKEQSELISREPDAERNQQMKQELDAKRINNRLGTFRIEAV